MRATAACVLLGACGYSSEFKAEFLAGCAETGGEPAYCRCVLGQLEDHGPPEDQITPQDQGGAIRACRSETAQQEIPS